MYLDSSAIVAVLSEESERPHLLHRIALDEKRTTSVVTMFESILALARKTGNRQKAPQQVRQFLSAAGVDVVAVDESCMDHLIEAFQKYHRGVGHAAGFNFGDCISYAVAKTNNLKILYVGNDFTHTDLA